VIRAAWVWIALIAAGCWHDPPPAAPDQPPTAPETATVRPLATVKPPCEVAVDHGLSIVESIPDLNQSTFSEREAQFRVLLVTRCEQMKWSDDLLQCIRAAETISDLVDGCREHLTPAQFDDVLSTLNAPPP
jgi:hypothetical protein